MLSDLSLNISSGNLTSGVEVDESIKSVICFIRENFKDFTIKNKDLQNANEKGMSQKLCIFLNRRASKYPFFFHSEFIENTNSGTSAQIDIGTISRDEKIIISDNEYGDDDSFFSLEAKRLPTPGTNREKEYVIGHKTPSGGIERFKKGIHAPRLKYAAIIGYVQSESFDHWYLTINSWIEKLIKENPDGFWNNDDKLKKVKSEDDSIIVELFSENLRRINNLADDKIQVYHFWINLKETSNGSNNLDE